jgi:DNA-binding NtrC family response regulator
MDRFTILIIEDKKSMAEMLAKTLDAEGYRSIFALSGEDGIAVYGRERVDLVLTDLKLPGMNGMEVLKALKARSPFLPVIMMTAFGSIENAVEAVKSGAYDFLTKPFDITHMLVLVEKALESAKLSAENAILKEEFSEELGFPKIIGKSRALDGAIDLIKKAAPAKATVFLSGESGTGKELFARALHHLSPRCKGAFVAINCAAIPKDLLESELFGYEKGAFTGADARKLGKFELADKGTLLLDEIGEMDMGIQAKLLRVLEDGRIERLGGTAPVFIDVRVVAASNKDVAAAVADGKFREDLFYRLNVFPVTIPPLRDRADDIPRLACHFAAKYCKELKKPVMPITDEALRELSSRHWKGNVRELENCIERAVILADAGIGLEHIGTATAAAPAAAVSGIPEPLQVVADRATHAAEAAAIRQALAVCGGNKTRASEMLEVSYKTLLTKIKDYGIG